MAAFTADSDNEADSHLKEAESRIEDIKNLTNTLKGLDSTMLAEQIVRYQSDGNKWNYMLSIEKYHAPGFQRCQPQSQCPKRSLKEGKLETLPEQTEGNWQDVNQACINFMLMNAQWTVAYIFGLFEKLVKTANCSSRARHSRKQKHASSNTRFSVKHCHPRKPRPPSDRFSGLGKRHELGRISGGLVILSRWDSHKRINRVIKRRIREKTNQNSPV